ncbi:longevity assurance proteins LAG1/LAC1 [Eremomyces bilateralis CBS 781.70]|uniref:Longevity assurance proteins LAG1/LAC1 n=1 Tax=Eremomyces bilateralis CBS 781.70 TaxID=1392243 RepID=A0A6G1GDH0_9PEZI|nr:longevity assurance proteins LAG1/LAC1 [Eremomyces bilateralis CBS 781.70]KAF1816088.1 longevity assurance proteins LAG1/LAC1 [Eremomyces bilateralis CBS 781.70]
MAVRTLSTSNGTIKTSNPKLTRPFRIPSEDLSPSCHRGPVARLCAWLVDHQIHISLTYLLTVFFIHANFPAARRRTRPLFVLPHNDPSTGKYIRGWDDLAFVASWTMVIMGLRVAMMEYVLKPFASAGGVYKTKELVRFAEQAWLVVYYSISWPMGMYIMYHSKYWLNLDEMWTDFPNREMGGLLKWYYLVQFAFWLQQIVVVHIEERRKDHWQMFAHHIVTCTLVLASYMSYQLNVGNVVLCLMDLSDIFLSAAKNLRYLKYQTACDACFGVFIITWLFTRHLCYLIVCYSIYSQTISIGCYDSATGARLSYDGGTDIVKNLFQAYVDPDGPVCYNDPIRYWFLGLLLSLQLLLIIWFGMIVRVALSVLRGKPADDSRSDDEGDDDEEGEEEEEDNLVEKMVEDVEAKAIRSRVDGTNGSLTLGSAPPQPYVEEEVGAEALRFVRQNSPPASRPYRKSSGRATGISIPGHGDRKELLGRIGCDKPA